MSKTILVVEDDPASMRLTQYMLEHKGYRVLTAANGLDGLKIARSEKPDLIILDVMLPGIDGLNICYQLRAEPETAGLQDLLIYAQKGPAEQQKKGDHQKKNHHTFNFLVSYWIIVKKMNLSRSKLLF